MTANRNLHRGEPVCRANQLFSAFITPVAAPILTFAVFSVMAQKSGDYTLDTARVFTSLSLFTLLAEPLASLIMSLATFMGSVGCYRRIQKFLLAESREDTRATPATTAFDKEDKEYQSSETNSSSPPSELEKQLNATMHVPDDMYSSHAEAISVRNGSFGWDKEKEPQLRSITMTVPRARLTMLVGPVGCGKSTLVKALLGEVPTIAGSVQLSSLKIAYCDQTAWHTNSTIQESITFFQEFDETWYNTVIRACALDEDLKQLPQGDQTQIGSNGIALSGGQSQRIVSFA